MDGSGVVKTIPSPWPPTLLRSDNHREPLVQPANLPDRLRSFLRTSQVQYDSADLRSRSANDIQSFGQVLRTAHGKSHLPERGLYIAAECSLITGD